MTFILPGSPILAYSIIDQRLTYTKTSKLWQFDKTSEGNFPGNFPI